MEKIFLESLGLILLATHHTAFAEVLFQSVDVCPIISGTNLHIKEKVLEKDTSNLHSDLNESNLWMKFVKFKI